MYKLSLESLYICTKMSSSFVLMPPSNDTFAEVSNLLVVLSKMVADVIIDELVVFSEKKNVL